jgi:hypothetical protein
MKIMALKENSAKRKISVNNEIVAMAKYQQWQRHGISENVGNIIMAAAVSEDENNESGESESNNNGSKEMAEWAKRNGKLAERAWHLIIAAYQQNEISA